MRQEKVNAGEWIADFIIGAGRFDSLSSPDNFGKMFYLVHDKGRQFFVTVDDEFITSLAVASPYSGRKFTRENYMDVT